MLKNVHPGEILLEEFLLGYDISQNRLGREIGMSPRAINEIVHGKRSITANSALRLAKYFGTSPEFWLSLQTSYDLEEAAKSIDLRGIKAIQAA
jgi:addiction module HigA family antidote